MVQLINGNELALDIQKGLRQKIVQLKLRPELAIILVGNDSASHTYVRLKKRSAQLVGIDFHEYLMPADVKEEQVLETINRLNQDKHLNSIVLQLPLPKHLNENRLISAINPLKDADGFHPENLKKLTNNKGVIKPALTKTILALLLNTKKNLKNKQALIIANSPVFAQPLIHELKALKIKASYITPLDKKTKDKIKLADIIIIAIGRPNFLTDKDCKAGSIIIDVGINKVNNKTQGDVSPKVYKKSKNIAWISPVPGGVGPVTIAMLLQNVVELTVKQNS